jgi:predicted dehydrogenase
VDLYRGVEVDIGGPQYTREDLHFLNALKNDQFAIPGIEEALRVQSTIDAAYKSARRRGAPEEVLSIT